MERFFDKLIKRIVGYEDHGEESGKQRMDFGNSVRIPVTEIAKLSKIKSDDLNMLPLFLPTVA